MSADSAHRPDATAMEAAAQWLVRLTDTDGPVSEQTMHGFREWLAQAAAHVVAFDRTIDAVDKLSTSVLPQSPSYRHAALDRASSADHATARNATKFWWAAIAAMLIVALPWLWPVYSLPDRTIKIVTAAQARTVKLSDGTKLSLDRGSEVLVRFTEDARLVRLVSGQARFQVGHEAARKFVVDTGRQNIFAVGTDFNVELAGPRSIISLLTGRIAVSRTDAPVPSGAAVTQIPSSALFLDQHQQLDVYADGKAFLRTGLSPTDMIAWERGLISLKNETLENAVRRLNRYAGSTMLIEGDGVGQMRISGVFLVNDRCAFVDAVSAVLPVTFNSADTKTTLSRGTARAGCSNRLMPNEGTWRRR